MRLGFGDAASLCVGPKSTQDFILGYSQSSLPGLDRFRWAYPALRAGLLSVVPTGTGSCYFHQIFLPDMSPLPHGVRFAPIAKPRLWVYV